MKTLLITAIALGAYANVALALSHHNSASLVNAQAESTATKVEMVDGEVRKIDTNTKKVTIKHGELKNLGMPPMTMVFQVKDPAMLEQVKAGDKVRFTADRLNGVITVTAIEPAR